MSDRTTISSATEVDLMQIVALHRLLDFAVSEAQYRQNVERFAEALDDPDGGREAAQAIRSLIGGIVLNSGEKRGEVHISLRGELMGILDLAHANRNQRESRFMTAAVAGPRKQI